LKERGYSKDTRINRGIILKGVLKEQYEEIWLLIVYGDGCREHGNDSSGSIECWEFHEQLSNY
jgi:hypothetical protein